MPKADLKLDQGGVDKLLEQINQAIEQFNEVRQATKQYMEKLEESLAGASKNAFSGKSREIQAALIDQYLILADAKSTCLRARESLTEADAQIAVRIN